MNVNLVIAGQSHLAAYLPAASARPDGPAEVPLGGAFVLDGPLPRDADYWHRLAELARGGTAAIVWGGDQHEAFLLESAPPLDFVLSTAPDLPLDPRASYVSESQLRAAFAPSFARLADVIEQLTAEGATVLVAGTTPPMDDVAALAARAALDERFADRFPVAEPDQPAPPGPPITSPYTLQKLWSLVQTMTGEAARAAGATFVPVPDRLRTTDGFLPQSLQGPGFIADAGFGREMAAEFAAVAAELKDRA